MSFQESLLDRASGLLLSLQQSTVGFAWRSFGTLLHQQQRRTLSNHPSETSYLISPRYIDGTATAHPSETTILVLSLAALACMANACTIPFSIFWCRSRHIHVIVSDHAFCMLMAHVLLSFGMIAHSLLALRARASGSDLAGRRQRGHYSVALLVLCLGGYGIFAARADTNAPHGSTSASLHAKIGWCLATITVQLSLLGGWSAAALVRRNLDHDKAFLLLTHKGLGCFVYVGVAAMLLQRVHEDWYLASSVSLTAVLTIVIVLLQQSLDQRSSEANESIIV
jgi:hypothetical protein